MAPRTPSAPGAPGWATAAPEATTYAPLSSGPASHRMDRADDMSEEEFAAVRQWTPDQVGAWLKNALNLGQYAAAFVRHEITGDLLASIDEHDLREIGIEVLGHRKRILQSLTRVKVAFRHHRRGRTIWEAGEARFLTACQKCLWEVVCGCFVPPGKHYKLTGLALRIRRTRWLGPCGACGSDVATDNIDLSEITDVDTYHHDVCAPCCCAAPDVVAVEFVDRPSGIETCSSGFATWIVHGESRRYRGCHVDRPRGIAAAPWVPRGSSAQVDRGEAGGSRLTRLRVAPGTGERVGMDIRNAHEELKEFQASGAASSRAGAGSYL